jgi:hypothetical protein
LNWRSLNNILDTLPEDEVLRLLNEERGNRRRVSILTRLHQRYCSLRAARERVEILSEGVAP